MQELLLFGLVPPSSHHLLLQQLAGIARMQPIPTTERHLIYRGVSPSGLSRIPQGGGGGSQGVLPPEVQRTKAMLQGPLFHIQLVKDVSEEVLSGGSNGTGAGDAINDAKAQPNTTTSHPKPWNIEFRDIPDPSTTSVTARLLTRTTVESGSPHEFMTSLGYDYVTQYAQRGHKFYSENTTVFLYQMIPIPEQVIDLSSTTLDPTSPLPSQLHFPAPSSSSSSPNNATQGPSSDTAKTLHPLDPTSHYILQASIEALPETQNTTGNQELKNRAIAELLGLRDLLKDAGGGDGLTLGPGERLSLDTRVGARR